MPPRIRRKQALKDPNPLLERAIKIFFRVMINFGDRQPDPVDAPLEDLYSNLQRWDLNKIDAQEAHRRTKQDRWLAIRSSGDMSGTIHIFADVYPVATKVRD